MSQKVFARGVLIIALCFALALPARADTNLKTAATEIVIGIVVVTAAATVLVVILIHKAKKTAITGCVRSGENGMTITDEKNSKIYALSGNTTGVKPDDRMKLKGSTEKSKGPNKTVVWDTRAVIQDFGGCPR